MAGIPRRTIEENLKKKGFRLEQGSHRRYVFYYCDKATNIRTWVSRGSRSHRDCGDDIIWAMRHQLKLDSISLVKRLLECPMDKNQYVKLLKEKQILKDET